MRQRLQHAGRCRAAPGRPVRPSRVHRFGAGARGRTGQPQRHRLARQTYAGARSRRGVDVLSRRDLRRHRVAGRPRRSPITAAVAAPASTSARPRRSWRRTGSMRGRCISYLTIEHAGTDPDRVAAGDRQPDLRLRRLPAGLPLEQICAAQRAARFRRSRAVRRCYAARRCGAGARPIFCATPKAARSAASATSAGAATSRWRWATCCAAARSEGASGQQKFAPHWLAQRDRPPSCCASISIGRWREPPLGLRSSQPRGWCLACRFFSRSRATWV